MSPITTAAPGTGVADAPRVNPPYLRTGAIENMEAGTTEAEALEDDTLALEPPGLRPRASASRHKPYESHVLDLLIVLSRGRQIILRTTLAAAVVTAAASLLLPNRYTATANILPPQQSPSLAASMIGQLGALGPMASLAQKDLG